MLTKSFRIALVLALFIVSVNAQRVFPERPTESGGPLSTEQSAFDVRHYDLKMSVDPDKKSIEGVLTMRAKIVAATDVIVLDLDTPFTVSSVTSRGKSLKFDRTPKQISVKLGRTARIGSNVEIAVAYSGIPKTAPAPPWVGGFVWSKTKDGQPWFATAVQMDGADLWWPVKDHPSDKPDTVALHFTVPQPLVAAANGRLQSVVDNKNGTRTYNWFVSQPISNYCIALNVAPYKVIKDSMKSVAGDMIPIEFYVLPEHFDKGQELVDKTKDYTRFFEEYLGPYPFRADKLGIAETPHLGMEHQSITAYGNEFKYDKNGFDWLMFHELGHEWWANLVTAPDWNDFWIHEGFQSFMDALFAEKRLGREQYVKSLPDRIKATKNLKPLAPRVPMTTTAMYLQPPDYVKGDGDIYGKGALVLNTLRGLIGDDAFFRALRRMSYADPKMEKVKNGKQFRFGTTDEFQRIAERESGRKLDWFFEVYARSAKLPTLVVESTVSSARFTWRTENNLPFELPIEVRVGDEIRKLDMKGKTAVISFAPGTKFVIDPNGWLLANTLEASAVKN